MPKRTGSHYFQPKINALGGEIRRCEEKYNKLYKLSSNYINCKKDCNSDCTDEFNKLYNFIKKK